MKKPDYINKNYNFNSIIGASVIDELPLWSASFGINLMKKINYRNNITMLDIGYGTGFPLIEIATRLGNDCKCYGIDIWNVSYKRIMQKIKFYNIKNIFPIEADATEIPLKSNSIDLITSCNGLNNIKELSSAIAECSRVGRKGCQFLITHNTHNTFIEFYNIFINVLKENQMYDEVKSVKEHIKEKRRSFSEYKNLLERNNFKIINKSSYKFYYYFNNAETFFNHILIKTGFIQSWTDMVPSKHAKKIFNTISVILDNNKPLKMSVPYILIEAIKI